MMFCEVDWWIDSWDDLWMIYIYIYVYIMIIITPSPLLMIIKFPTTSVSISLLCSVSGNCPASFVTFHNSAPRFRKTCDSIWLQGSTSGMNIHESQLWIDLRYKKTQNPPGFLSQSPVPPMVKAISLSTCKAIPVGWIAEVLYRIKSPVSMVKS